MLVIYIYLNVPYLTKYAYFWYILIHLQHKVFLIYNKVFPLKYRKIYK